MPERSTAAAANRATEAEQFTLRTFGLHEARRVAVQRGGEDLVVREAGLHRHPSPIGSATHQPAGPCEQGKCLFRRPVARGEELLVELEEPDEVDAWHPVQDRLRADDDSGVRDVVAVARHLSHRRLQQRFELLASA